MAATGGSIGVLSCPSSYFKPKARPTPPPSSSLKSVYHYTFAFNVNNRRKMCCLAVQEPSTSTVGEVKKAEKEEGAAAEKPKPRARASAAKAPAKPLPQLMEEDVIPSLKTTLQAQQHISDLQISFDGNKLEGSFLNKGVPHSFWAFFADGTITGPKGFSLSSYGSGVSTVEPFLVDEKRPTAKHVVFWVEKRLAAQGIIPVWRD